MSAVSSLTANASGRDAVRCHEAGMNDFISKPVRPAQPYAVLLRNLDRRAAAGDFPPATVGAGGTAEPGGDAPAAFDPRVFDELTEGHASRASRLAEAFATSARRSLEDLARAVAAGDDEAIGRFGHKLKSTARWIGALALGQMAQALEQMPPGRRLEAGRRMQPALASHVERAFENMKSIISNMK